MHRAKVCKMQNEDRVPALRAFCIWRVVVGNRIISKA